MKKRLGAEQNDRTSEAEKICRTNKGREELQNSSKKTRFTEQRKIGKN